MESATQNSPPFRIGSEPVQKDNTQNNNNSSSQSPPTRVLVPGEGTDQWVCTMSQDFSTFTFAQVYQLFKAALSNQKQNGLIVSRMVCNVPSPYEFRFCEDSLKVLRTENAGGASEFSEAVSFEIFHRMFGAQLEKTEMDIRYDSWSKKTDYSVRMFDQKIAVSVTRAMKFRGVWTDSDAFRLLHKKLLGVQMSNENVCEADRWNKQVLHIMCEHVYIVESLRNVFSWMSEHTPQLIGNTVVLITLTANAPFLYFNFCSEQANMQFHATDTPDSSVVASENTFTTPAIKDTCSAPRFVSESEEDEIYSGLNSLDMDIDEISFGVPGRKDIPGAAGSSREALFFYYGFPITTKHGALALRWYYGAPQKKNEEAGEQIWNNEQFLFFSKAAASLQLLPRLVSREVGMRETQIEGKPAKRGKMINTTATTTHSSEGEAEVSVMPVLPKSISFLHMRISTLPEPIHEEKKEATDREDNDDDDDEDAFLAPKPRLLAAFQATFVAKPAEAQLPKSEIFKSAGSESHAAVQFRGSVIAFLLSDD